MKKLIAVALLLALAVPAFAGPEGSVSYVGGTAPNVKVGDYGKFDTTDPAKLIFNYQAGHLEMPYAQMSSYRYYTEVAHHLGVVAAVVVGLTKRRQRDHFFRITYKDASGTEQVGVFEVPKEMPPVLQPILQARIPKKEPVRNWQCGSACNQQAVAQPKP